MSAAMMRYMGKNRGDCRLLISEMCGPLFAKTTAAQVPVDGGNERVI